MANQKWPRPICTHPMESLKMSGKNPNLFQLFGEKRITQPHPCRARAVSSWGCPPKLPCTWRGQWGQGSLSRTSLLESGGRDPPRRELGVWGRHSPSFAGAQRHVYRFSGFGGRPEISDFVGLGGPSRQEDPSNRWVAKRSAGRGRPDPPNLWRETL